MSRNLLDPPPVHQLHRWALITVVILCAAGIALFVVGIAEPVIDLVKSAVDGLHDEWRSW